MATEIHPLAGQPAPASMLIDVAKLVSAYHTDIPDPTVAAGMAGFIGFAVGRTSFWDAVSDYRARTLTRAGAAMQIAGRLREWVVVFEAGRLSRATGTA